VDLDVVFLGTSGSAPTAQRATSATLVRRGGDKLLIDCGEGTQRQLLRSDVGLADLEDVLLTHFHADHYLGLPGMLKSFALRGRELPLRLYGPVGLRDLLAVLGRVFGGLSYPIETLELEPGDAIDRGDYEIRAFAVNHGAQSIGYVFAEADRPGRFDVEVADGLGVPPGKERGLLQRGEAVVLASGETITPDQVLGPARPSRSLALTGDTGPAASVVDAVTGVDVLVHEATFGADERQRARETNHSTAAEAALTAKAAGVGLLALTHLSARYFGSEVAEEARQVFPATVVPRDFDVIEIPYAERGEPVLVPRGARRRRDPATPQPEECARPTHLTSAPERASTTRCDPPTLPGGRPSRRWSSWAICAVGGCSISAAERGGCSPPSLRRRMRRPGASTTAPRWLPLPGRRSRPVSASAVARLNGCRFVTGGSTG
jgi:ribonuclease Z